MIQRYDADQDVLKLMPHENGALCLWEDHANHVIKMNFERYEAEQAIEREHDEEIRESDEEYEEAIEQIDYLREREKDLLAEIGQQALYLSESFNDNLEQQKEISRLNSELDCSLTSNWIKTENIETLQKRIADLEDRNTRQFKMMMEAYPRGMQEEAVQMAVDDHVDALFAKEFDMLVARQARLS